MKNIIQLAVFILLTSVLSAQTLQKPSTLPTPSNPGNTPSVSPKPKALADLTIRCSGTSFEGRTTGQLGTDALTYSFSTHITLTITNHGGVASRVGSLCGFIKQPAASTTSWPTPIFINLKEDEVRSSLGWNRLTSEACDNSLAAIEPGATVSIECVFTGETTFGKTGGFYISYDPNDWIFTAAVDFGNTTIESSEVNNVSVPIHLTRSRH